MEGNLLSIGHIKILLNAMAAAFNDQVAQISTGETEKGWGQFLNIPKEQNQIGPYGTCAGIIVTRLAYPDQQVESEIAETLLRHWRKWFDEENRSGRYFVQNLRLAFLLLAIHQADTPRLNAIRDEVSKTIFDRQIGAGLWGDWYITDEIRDRNESIFVTAIIILAFSLRKERSAAFPRPIVAAAKQLIERIKGRDDLDSFDVRAALAAVLNCIPGQLDSKTIRKAKRCIRLFRFRRIDNPYFFDYRFLEKGTEKFGRDYFLIPDGILEILMAHRLLLGTSAMLGAHEIAERFVDVMGSGNERVFRLGGSPLPTTVDQAWVAIALCKLFDQNAVTGLWARAWYQIRKERPDNWIWSLAIPLLTLGIAAFASLSPEELVGTVRDLLINLQNAFELPQWIKSPSTAGTEAKGLVDQVVQIIGILMVAWSGNPLYRRADNYIRRQF